MTEEKNLENSKKKLKVYYSLLISVICLIGVSFAIFSLFLRQQDSNAVTALSCFTSTLTEENSAINLENEFPISDENGMKKTPFTFKLTNNCNNYVRIYITIDPLNEGTTNYILSKYIKANVSTKGSIDGTSLIIGTQNTKVLDNKHNGYIVKEVGLNKDESKELDLRLWIDYDTTKEQAAGMTYPSQVVIVTEPGKLTFADTILANNEVQTPLTTPGEEVSAHIQDDITETSITNLDRTPQRYYVTYGTGWEANGSKFNLTGTAVTSDIYANSYSTLVGKYLPGSIYNAGSNTAGEMQTTTNLGSVYYVVSATSNSYTYKILSSNKNTTEALLASTEDDYGTSYYFRGAVKNNYVQFANKCWRIVRIVGDGSVKLVLHNDNTSNTSNPCSPANYSIVAAFARYSEDVYTSAFNSSKNDNTYAGFMYGTVGSSDYASTHANINKSTILTNLETWYKNNLSSYEDKLADTIWCNDKSVITDTDFDPWRDNPSSNFGTGVNTNYFSTTRRLVSDEGNAGGTGPSLICPNDNNGGKLSKFTVSDTTNGNGDLTYKIGLLTADELVFAGSILGSSNLSTYLQENTAGMYWWTLSPSRFNDVSYTRIWGIYWGNSADDDADGTSGVRPSISLKSSTSVTGSGTSEDPYIVE